MRTITVTENLIQLTRLRFVNAYLVREDDGFTLVDTTIAGAADALIGAARAAGGEIRRIVLTHGHADHVGSLDVLKETLGVPVYMPELDARIHAGEKPYEGKLRGGWPKLKTVADDRIDDGERIGSLKVVATPGHTPGHISLLDTRDRSLLAGDALETMGGIAIPDHFKPRFPLVWAATWDRARAGESAQVLRALEPTLI